MSEPTATVASGRTSYRPRHRAESAESAGSAEQAAPAVPVVPRQVARVYQTPVWADGSTHAPTATRTPLPAVVEAEEPAPAFVRPEGLLTHARWTTPRQGRAAVALLLLAFLAAAVAAGTGAVQAQTTPALALSLACLLGAAGMFAILAVLRPVVIELDEVWLTVRQAGYCDRFDLTNPFQELETTGRVGSGRWRLRLGCPDGRVVVVTGAMVDSRRLEPVVAYAQRYAERDRAARVLRFNR
jgi:hypothetical protein